MYIYDKFNNLFIVECIVGKVCFLNYRERDFVLGLVMIGSSLII